MRKKREGVSFKSGMEKKSEKEVKNWKTKRREK